MFSKSCDDLSKEFPNGASSIIVNKTSQTSWEVYSEPHFLGAKVTLEKGQVCDSLEKMGIMSPVKSFRKSPFDRSGFVFLDLDEV